MFFFIKNVPNFLDSKIVKQNVTYDTTTGKVYEELGGNNNNNSSNNNNNNNSNTQRASYFQVENLLFLNFPILRRNAICTIGKKPVL